MIVLSGAGNYRLVGHYSPNTIQLVLEVLDNGKWKPSEDNSVMTLGIAGMRQLADGADEAWGDWR